MTERPQTSADSASAAGTPDIAGAREPWRAPESVKGPVDFMGLPAHDQRASAAAIRAYFARPPKR